MNLSTISNRFLNVCAGKLKNIVLPTVCILCGRVSSQSIDLCHACELELPYIITPCSRCGLPLNSSREPGILCGECLKTPPLYSTLITNFSYQFPIDNFITKLKFSGKLLYGKLLSELLLKEIIANEATSGKPDFIIPVPLHPKRLQERGYNQALEIAKPIAKKLKIPIDFLSCSRIRATDPQSLIPANHRAKNMKDAFRVQTSFRARHIAIVDDVVTTGQTVNELIKVLKKAGVQEVQVWCCARTILNTI